MRRSALALVVCLCACASTPKRAQHPREDDDAGDVKVALARSPEHAARKIRLVTLAPRAGRYRCLGKISGAADVSDWVEATKDARTDLWRKAAALGADLVKIDRVIIPAEHAHGRLVLLAGRAYRANETD